MCGVHVFGPRINHFQTSLPSLIRELTIIVVVVVVVVIVMMMITNLEPWSAAICRPDLAHGAYRISDGWLFLFANGLYGPVPWMWGCLGVFAGTHLIT